MKFEQARFHIKYGPESLFERVMFKMKGERRLQLNDHCIQRCAERKVPSEVVEKIVHFNEDDWQLVTAQVRVDKGKFIASTWKLTFDGVDYWMTIGWERAVTVVRKTSDGLGGIIKNGPVYDYVEQVNRKLMEEEIADNNTGEVNEGD